MDMSNFRPDLHVAQQSRRDKLRIQPDPNPTHNQFGVYTNNLNGPNYDSSCRPGNICYDSWPQNFTVPSVENFSRTLVSNNHDPRYFSTDNWVGNSNYAIQQLTTSSINAPTEAGCYWNGEFGDHHKDLGATVATNTQTLSLSLSTLQRDPKILGIATTDHRNPGPFTGYATILTGSRFLSPAQQLLEELCFVAQPNHNSSEEVIRVTNGDTALRGGDSGGSSSFSFREAGGASYSYRPQNLQRKAKLLYMQDEVFKKFKQYHQQMQMVVSSFESVPGLNAAAPFVSIARKMVSKHFQCLKNAITDQLKNIRNVLGEDSSSLPSAGTRGDGDVSILKFFDQSNVQKPKSTGRDLDSIIEGQHTWRPQRGLPERAVSILRAWLFDHFLHPYPTDTDKHMLATQTGLTRNQVSNWFINARVRIWKPMVEEIHMLETKGMGKTVLADPTSMNKEELKRSRMECHDPSVFDAGGSLMPSHHIEMSGFNAVSLTLGLPQSAENRQHHFGGQIIRDFVG